MKNPKLLRVIEHGAYYALHPIKEADLSIPPRKDLFGELQKLVSIHPQQSTNLYM